MDCFVYVLGSRSKGRTLTYVGWTHDMLRRLAQHNAGKGARTTRGRQWVLLHSEWFPTKREAMSREWHLKRERAFRKKLALAMPATKKPAAKKKKVSRTARQKQPGRPRPVA